MDTPEPPAIWPPAPTLPPPEQGLSKPSKLQKWLVYILKDSVPVYAIWMGIDYALGLIRHSRLPSWQSHLTVGGTLLLLNSVKFWWRVWRQSKEKL